jgi:serine/threonine protein kinase
MTELGNCEIAAIGEDGEFIVSRVKWATGPSPRLVVSPALERATASIGKFEHAYALRVELDSSWAARPLEFVNLGGRPALVIEDPGGEFLDKLIGSTMVIPDLLRLAIGLAKALGCLHARGLIHRDFKPANTIVDTATGEVWLTGFGLTSHLPRYRQSPEPPEVIVGTLAYMAPEQTGRMNRSMDARSDLYSLGVTLYELCTGTLPFTASDPMEWIHCHIARQPLSLSKRVDGLPPAIDSIVLKLLAKNPEDRYRTAAGVETDLRKCLEIWMAEDDMGIFELGERDISDRLLIPEKLYGRDAEIEVLLAASKRVMTHGTSEMVFVSGNSGIGKSSFVNELHKVLVPRRGLFAAGKFDQYKRDIP